MLGLSSVIHCELCVYDKVHRKLTSKEPWNYPALHQHVLSWRRVLTAKFERSAKPRKLPTVRNRKFDLLSFYLWHPQIFWIKWNANCKLSWYKDTITRYSEISKKKKTNQKIAVAVVLVYNCARICEDVRISNIHYSRQHVRSKARPYCLTHVYFPPTCWLFKLQKWIFDISTANINFGQQCLQK